MLANANSLRFPTYYIELAESLLRSRQRDLAQVYTRCGITPAARQQEGMTLNLPQFLALVVICQENLLPGEPSSLQLLRHLPVTAHGMIGLAAMTADTLDQALDVGLRYFPLTMPAFELYRQRVGNEAHVLVRRVCDFGSPLNETLTELIIGSFNSMLFFASASRLGTAGKMIELGMPVEFVHTNGEEYIENFNAFFRAPVKFGCAENKFIVPRSVLQQPLLTRNHNAHTALIATLEWQLSGNAQPKPITQKVRNQLMLGFSVGKLFSATEIAYELGLSTRTMSRRLNDEGFTLPEIMESVRMERAEFLLVSSDIQVAKIAQQLGYTETAAFSRAFKRHTGKSPSDLRAIKG